MSDLTPRIMVDMSATLIHHGHIRLIQRASAMGSVVVGLCSDDEILKKKGYEPELAFEERREILLAIRGVDEVVMVPWMVTAEILDKHDIDLLAHGDDNSNQVPPDRTVIFPRAEGISSWQLRERAVRALMSNLRRRAPDSSRLGEIEAEVRELLLLPDR